MAFELGNQEAKKADHKKPRIITQKLIARLQDAEGAALDRMVGAIIARAQEGDVPAFREIMDRVEGKAPQPIENSEDGAFKIEVSWQPVKS
jgi:hypothetical protein